MAQTHLHQVHATDPTTIAERLNEAQTYCRLNGSRFTALRRQIYELILMAKQPLGAYDLIAQLQQTRQQQSVNQAHSECADNNKPIRPVAPPTIYRTLDFLLEQGFIHQLNSINAFIPCCHPRDKHVAAFLICRQCQRVHECSSAQVQDVLGFAKDEMGFTVINSMIELLGLCNQCETATKVAKVSKQ